jgi:hypothetical protein
MNYSTTFTSRHAHWITPTFFFLAVYTVGAGMLDSFAMYHSWRFVSAVDFPLMHKEAGSRIVRVLVLPSAIMTIFLILQLWHRPTVVSRKLVWVALISAIITWLSSFFIQIPLQIKLDHDPGLLEQLITSDWIRVVSNFVFAIAVFVMMRKSVTGYKA